MGQTIYRERERERREQEIYISLYRHINTYIFISTYVMFYIVDINKYICVCVCIYLYLYISCNQEKNQVLTLDLPYISQMIMGYSLNLLSLISLLNNEESTHGLTDYMLDITLGFLGTQAGMVNHNSP